MPAREEKERAGRHWRGGGAGFWMVVLLGVLTLELAFINLFILVSDLPGVDRIENFNPPLITEIYDHEGNLLDSFYSERRRLVKLSDLKPEVIAAFLAAEDAEFYWHEGVDLQGILRAAYTNYKQRKITQGGSTITQQVVCNLLLSRQRTFERKTKEAILAFFLERRLSKDEILSIYLNLVYFGNGAYGVEEAALTFFGVPARDLSVGQAAFLAGLIQAPSRFSPRENFVRAKRRQEWVLEQMVKQGFLSAERAEEVKQEELVLNESWPPVREPVSPYYVNAVKAELLNILGEEAYHRGGYKVYTALDLELQAKAEAAVRRGIERLNPGPGRWGIPTRRLVASQREAYLEEQEMQLKRRGSPLKPGDVVDALITGYHEGVVELMVGRHSAHIPLAETPWRAPRPGRKHWRDVPVGDVISTRVKEPGEPLLLEPLRKPVIEAALVAIEPVTHRVKAVVGGYDYALSQFNRATQSRRPPGSAMKPFVYSAAFSTREWTPSSVIVDNAAPIGLEEGGFWRPRNYSGGYYGPTSLHYALVHSRNIVTAKLAYRLGIRAVIDHAHLLGLTENFPPALSISLGAYGVRLIEMVNAYAAFASGGFVQKPVLITHIVDRNGQLIYTAPLMPEPVLSPAEAYQMTYILHKVTTSGTATRALALGRPSAGKTGTTSDFRDSWYVGYTPQLVTGVWVGRDDFKRMPYGMTGSKGALPIWVEFMRSALAGEPVEWYKPPSGVYFRYGLCFLEGTKATRPVVGGGEDGEEPKKKEEEEKKLAAEGKVSAGEEEAVSEALSEAGRAEEGESESQLLAERMKRSGSRPKKSSAPSSDEESASPTSPISPPPASSAETPAATLSRNKKPPGEDFNDEAGEERRKRREKVNEFFKKLDRRPSSREEGNDNF